MFRGGIGIRKLEDPRYSGVMQRSQDLVRKMVCSYIMKRGRWQLAKAGTSRDSASSTPNSLYTAPSTTIFFSHRQFDNLYLKEPQKCRPGGLTISNQRNGFCYWSTKVTKHWVTVGSSTTLWLAKDHQSPRLGYPIMVKIAFSEQSLKPNTDMVGLLVPWELNGLIENHWSRIRPGQKKNKPLRQLRFTSSRSHSWRFVRYKFVSI
jgi:hypothetical protein